jgi:hypothetical protein
LAVERHLSSLLPSSSQISPIFTAQVDEKLFPIERRKRKEVSDTFTSFSSLETSLLINHDGGRASSPPLRSFLLLRRGKQVFLVLSSFLRKAGKERRGKSRNIYLFCISARFLAPASPFSSYLAALSRIITAAG